ncbi:MAG: rRNA pseudouridine synthase [Heliobacteriaceae bacterium]|jgi:23S rRNA pseudouridine2605 synthase|nr:rRNA pseudouridine synthase [Heliobacteriaceae bacterium]
MPRLNRYIASSGLCSRRKADELIEQRKVNVNGKVITEPGFSVNDKDKVFVNQKLVRPVKHQYYKFYKPAGYITTSSDEKGRKTIYDLLPDSLANLKPAGRLDKASTGLLILTNDGDLINELTHPSVKVPKIYLVTINGRISRRQLEQMALGIEIEPDKTAYADVTVLEADNKHTLMQITLHQGLNRQIRKMFEHLGFEVKSLKRIQHAAITLDGLKKGEFKPIKPIQIKELRFFLNKLKGLQSEQAMSRSVSRAGVKD